MDPVIVPQPKQLDKQQDGGSIPMLEEKMQYQWVEPNLTNSGDIDKHLVQYVETEHLSDNNAVIIEEVNQIDSLNENSIYHVENLEPLGGKIFTETVKETDCGEDWASSIVVQPFVPSEEWSSNPPGEADLVQNSTEDLLTFEISQPAPFGRSLRSPISVKKLQISSSQDDSSYDSDSTDSEYIEEVCVINDEPQMRKKVMMPCIESNNYEHEEEDDDSEVMFFQPLVESVKHKTLKARSVQSIREEMMLQDSQIVPPIDYTCYLPSKNQHDNSRFHHNPHGLQDLSRAAQLLSEVKPCFIKLDRAMVPRYLARCQLKSHGRRSVAGGFRKCKRPVPKSRRPMPKSKKLTLLSRMKSKSPPSTPTATHTRRDKRVAETKKPVKKSEGPPASKVKVTRELSKRIKARRLLKTIKIEEESYVARYAQVIEQVVKMKISNKSGDTKRKLQGNKVAVKKEKIAEKKKAIIKKEKIADRKKVIFKTEKIAEKKKAIVEKEKIAERKKVIVKKEKIDERKKGVAEKEKIAKRKKTIVKKERIAEWKKAIVEKEKNAERKKTIVEKKKTIIEKEKIAERKKAIAKKQKLAERKKAIVEKEKIAEKKKAIFQKGKIAERKKAIVEKEKIAERKRAIVEKEKIAEMKKTIAERKKAVIEKKKTAEKKKKTIIKTEKNADKKETTIREKEIIKNKKVPHKTEIAKKKDVTLRKKEVTKRKARLDKKEDTEKQKRPQKSANSIKKETLTSLKVNLSLPSKRGRNKKLPKTETVKKESISKTDGEPPKKRPRLAVHSNDVPRNNASRSKSWSSRRRTFQCKYCLKKYFVASSFYNHISNQHGKRSQPCVCDKCNRQFKNIDSLSRHDRLYHRGQYAGLRHPCIACGKTYNLKGGLTTHYRVQHPHIVV